MHVHHIGAQPLAGDLETQQCAGGVFNEGVDDGEARQTVVMFPPAAVQLHPLLGLVQQEQDLVALQGGNADKAGMREGGRPGWVTAGGGAIW